MIFYTSCWTLIKELIWFTNSGNILVIITVFSYLNRRNVTNMFIVNLSVSDTLVIVFALPFRVSTSFVLHGYIWNYKLYHSSKRKMVTYCMLRQNDYCFFVFCHNTILCDIPETFAISHSQLIWAFKAVWNGWCMYKYMACVNKK